MRACQTRKEECRVWAFGLFLSVKSSAEEAEVVVETKECLERFQGDGVQHNQRLMSNGLKN